MEGPTTKRDFREKRKSGEVFPFGGSFPQKITRKGGGQNPSVCGGGGGRGWGGGVFAPQYICM